VPARAVPLAGAVGSACPACRRSAVPEGQVFQVAPLEAVPPVGPVEVRAPADRRLVPRLPGLPAQVVPPRRNRRVERRVVVPGADLVRVAAGQQREARGHTHRTGAPRSATARSNSVPSDASRSRLGVCTRACPQQPAGPRRGDRRRARRRRSPGNSVSSTRYDAVRPGSVGGIAGGSGAASGCLLGQQPVRRLGRRLRRIAHAALVLDQ
jgi:hypothetical protein